MEVLEHILEYDKFFKELLTKKTKFPEEDMMELATICSELVQKNIK